MAAGKVKQQVENKRYLFSIFFPPLFWHLRARFKFPVQKPSSRAINSKTLAELVSPPSHTKSMSAL